MVDKAWTFEEAWAAQQSFKAAHPAKPRGPLYQWSALHQLDELEKKAGDKGTVLQAIYLCSVDDLPIPEWAAKGFINQYAKGLNGRVSSWDKVFGRPRTRGMVERFMRDVEIQPKVWGLIVEAKDNGELIGTTLFERIAESLGTNRDKVAKAYRSYRSLIHRDP